MAMQSTVVAFKRDLDDYAKKTNADLQLVVKTVVFELFRRIVLRTPIDEGRAAGNWNVSANVPGTTHDDAALGVDVAMLNLKKVSFEPLQGVYWLFNNLPYIEVLEFGLFPNPPKKGTGKTVAGFSVQAPQGMVRVTIAEVDAEMESVLRRVVRSG